MLVNNGFEQREEVGLEDGRVRLELLVAVEGVRVHVLEVLEERALAGCNRVRKQC